MRIIRLRIDTQVRKYLREISRTYSINDAGWTEDLYSLIRLKGSGLPTKERISKMAKSAAKRRREVTEISVNLLISKRKLMFAGFISTPYFLSLATLTDPIKAVNRFLVNMKKMYAKTRQSQCTTCSLKSACDFGKQYAANFNDITKVIDPDFANKVNPACPALPEIDGFNQMVEGFKQFNALVQASANAAQANLLNSAGGANLNQMSEQALEAEENAPDVIEDDDTDSDVLADPEKADFHVPNGAAPGASGTRWDGCLDGEQLCKVSENLIDKVSQTQLKLFDLGRKFTDELTAQKRGKFKPVSQTEIDKTSTEIKKESDLPTITPSQHGLPTEVFNARLEKKTLTKTQFRKPEDKKKLLYLLIDISGSMLSMLGGNVQNGLFLRTNIATLFSIAVAKRVRDDKGIVYARFFTGAPSPLQQARTADEFEALINWLSLPSCTSGSTNISSVIAAASADIQFSKDELASTEILLITDCEDCINESAIRQMLGKTELNTLDVAGGSINSVSAQTLRRVSNKYFKANEAEPDITKIVSLL